MNRSTDTKRIRNANRRFSRRRFLDSVAVFSGALVLRGAASAWQTGARISTTDLNGAFLLQGAGGNVLALRGPSEERRQGVPGDQGALMVDGGLAANAEALIAAVKTATGATRVHTLFNTHGHQEQVGANEIVGRAGGVIIAHEKTQQYLSNSVESVEFKGRRAPLPQPARPTKTVRGEGSMEFGGQQIEAGYMLQAHTDSDIYVHFPQAKLLMVGDVVSPGRYPDLDWSTGGWITGMVEGQRALLAVAKDDTRIVAGTGGVMTKADLQAHFDKLLAIRDGMVKLFRQGKGADEMQADGLTKEYDAQWGDPKQFLHNAYHGMWGHVREVGGIV